MKSRSVGVVVCLVVSMPAQARFAEVHETVPMVMYGVEAQGDFDGDGIVDHVFFDAQRGKGRWVSFGPGDVIQDRPITFPPAASPAGGMLLADLDGDNDADIITWDTVWNFGSGVVGGTLRSYRNLGGGAFQPIQAFGGGPSWFSGEIVQALAVGDIDADGDRDLVVAVAPHVQSSGGGGMNPPSYSSTGGQNRLWINHGNGSFFDGTIGLPFDNSATTSVCMFDCEGDGDLDIYFGNTQVSAGIVSSQDMLLRNNGTSGFVPGPFPWDVRSHDGSFARDFDADGDIDLLLRDAPMRLLVNDGAGSFAEHIPPLAAMPLTYRMHVGDWNGDGRTDYGLLQTIVGPNQVHWQPVVNLGGGLFADWPAGNVTLNSIGQRRIHVADYENDGDVDLVAFGTWVDSRVARSAPFTSMQMAPFDWADVEISAVDAAVVDVEADGDPDLFVGGQGGAAFFRNDGHGSFVRDSVLGITSDTTTIAALAAGDLDGDGDADLVVSRLGLHTVVLWNVQGTFASMTTLPAYGQDVAIGDLYGDSRPDIYVGAYSQDVVFHNLGAGSFAAVPGMVPTGLGSQHVHLADLDGDGDRDVLAAAFAVSVLRNNGQGLLLPWTNTGIATTPGAIAVGDWNNDGDCDVVLGADVYHNNGSGTFTAVATGVPAAPGRRLVAADFDNDGDLDLYRGPYYAPDLLPGMLSTNDGSGGFTPQPNAVAVRAIQCDAVAVADLDGDADLDLVHAQSGAPVVAFNLRHHLQWTSLPRVGHILNLQCNGAAHEPWILGLSGTAVSMPIPGFGVLRLDPASLAIVAGGVGDHTGEATMVVSVPAAPWLLGVSGCWQALFLNGPSLSNLERTTLLAQ